MLRNALDQYFHFCIASTGYTGAHRTRSRAYRLSRLSFSCVSCSSWSTLVCLTGFMRWLVMRPRQFPSVVGVGLLSFSFARSLSVDVAQFGSRPPPSLSQWGKQSVCQIVQLRRNSTVVICISTMCGSVLNYLQGHHAECYGTVQTHRDDCRPYG